MGLVKGRVKLSKKPPSIAKYSLFFADDIGLMKSRCLKVPISFLMLRLFKNIEF